MKAQPTESVFLHPDTPVIHAARLAAESGYILTYDQVLGRVILKPRTGLRHVSEVLADICTLQLGGASC